MKDEDFKLLRGFVTDGQTDRRTNERTFVIVESLSRLKNYILRCVMVQNIYFNTFFVKIDPGAPLKPPKSSFF